MEPRNEYERLDTLFIGGYKILQDSRLFCFGTDAVLLAGFARIQKGDRVADLGCGNGILEILLLARHKEIEICGIELQKESAALAKRNLAGNGLADRGEILCGDLKDAPALLGKGVFRHVVCNPPYKEEGGGLLNESDAKKAARHEIHCTLSDVLSAASALLCFSGKLSIIYKPERLSDLLCGMREQKIEAKRLLFVHPAPGKAPELVLVEGQRGAKKKMKILPPLYIRGADGAYTPEFLKFYGEKL